MSSGDMLMSLAEHQDVPELRALVQRAYRGEDAGRSWSHEGEFITGERISAGALAALICDPSRVLYVAKLSERIVGAALIGRLGDFSCRIGLLAVELDLHGQGIGSRILQHAEEQAVAVFSSTHVSIEVVAHKRKRVAYYLRRGYEDTGQSRPYAHAVSKPARLLTLSKRLYGPYDHC